jgi:biopolymer transport protein ExbD
MSVELKKGRALGNLSLTPLIDIVFLLLIFFLVATRFAEEDREMDVRLPAASEAMPLTVKPRELFVNINDKGEFIVSGKKMKDQEELFVVIRRAVDNNPGSQSVVIRGDERSMLRYAVQVMNLCNRAGVKDYTINTAPGG